MSVPILISIGTKLTKLENMPKLRFIWFIWRHVTQKRYVMRHGDSILLIDILTGNNLKPTRSLYDFRFKSYGSNSGFRVFGDLDLDLYLFSIVCHTHCAWCTGISMRSFIRIRPVILGDMPWTHTHTHTHTPKVILIVSRNARLIIIDSLHLPTQTSPGCIIHVTDTNLPLIFQKHWTLYIAMWWKLAFSISCLWRSIGAVFSVTTRCLNHDDVDKWGNHGRSCQSPLIYIDIYIERESWQIRPNRPDGNRPSLNSSKQTWLPVKSNYLWPTLYIHSCLRWHTFIC